MKLITIFILLIAFYFMYCSIPSLADDFNARELTRHQKIYYLQHRLFPEWTHKSNGAFFADLMQGNSQRLLEAAEQIVDKKFSDRIVIQTFADHKGVLIKFPPPNESPECYFIFIKQREKGYLFYTYEKSLNLFGTGEKGVVGSWTANMKHLNMGERMYDDAESFINEVLGK